MREGGLLLILGKFAWTETFIRFEFTFNQKMGVNVSYFIITAKACTKQETFYLPNLLKHEMKRWNWSIGAGELFYSHLHTAPHYMHVCTYTICRAEFFTLEHTSLPSDQPSVSCLCLSLHCAAKQSEGIQCAKAFAMQRKIMLSKQFLLFHSWTDGYCS